MSDSPHSAATSSSATNSAATDPSAVATWTPERPGSGPPGRPSLGWTELAVAVVAYLALGLAFGYVLFLVTGSPVPTVPTVAVTGLATLATVALVLALRVRAPASIGLRGTTARWLLLGVAGGVLGWLVNRGVVLAFIAISGDGSNPQQGLSDAAGAQGWSLVGLLFAGAVLVPIAEELLFRGIGYGALRRFGPFVATVVSAVLFGLAHGLNVVLPAAIVLGVINAVLYERSRSIWPSVVAHGTNNAIIFGLAALLTG